MVKGLVAFCLLGAAIVGQPQVRTPRPLEGYVLDRFGRPAAGVEVYLTWRKQRSSPRDPEQLVQLLARTRTDGKGYFSIPRRPSEGPLEATVTIFARSPTGGSVGEEIWSSYGSIQLRFPPVSTLVLNIVDADGQPRPGTPINTRLGHVMEPIPQRFRANSSGQVSMVGNAGDQLLPSIPDDRYDLVQPEFIDFPPEGETATATIKVVRAASIIGRVVDAVSGRPMAGVKVGAMQETSGFPRTWFAMTDSHGRYDIHKIWPGDYSVSISDERLGQVPIDVTHAALAVGATLQLSDLRALVPGQVRCFVRSKGTGKPIPSRQVVCRAAKKNDTGTTAQLSWRNGVGVLSLQPGSYTIQVNGVSKSCEVVSLKAVDLDFMVEPQQREATPPNGPAIPPKLGKIIGPDGQPVPFAAIYENGDCGGLADSTGVFDMAFYGNGGAFRFAKGGLASRLGTTFDHDSQTGNRAVMPTFRLEPGILAGVLGRVLDSTGKPLADAVVDILIGDPKHPTIAETVVTGADGSFSIGGLWPDTDYEFKASAKGFKSAVSNVFQLKMGESRDFGVIKLR